VQGSQTVKNQTLKASQSQPDQLFIDPSYISMHIQKLVSTKKQRIKAIFEQSNKGIEQMEKNIDNKSFFKSGVKAKPAQSPITLSKMKE